MKRIGLTGGIGMGKSTVASMIRSLGIPVLDSDTIARQLVGRGSEALKEIQTSFGDHVLLPDGGLDRAKLAGLVFADPELRKRLEAILHPRIRASWLKELDSLEKAGNELAVVDIPLLFETQAQQHFAATVFVWCSTTLQSERLKARGWTEPEQAKRIAAQLPVSKKMEMATYLIWNCGPLAVTAHQTKRIFEQIRTGAFRIPC